MIPVKGIGLLRAPEQSDLDWLHSLENNPSLWYLGYSKEPFSREVLRNYLEQQPGSLLRDGQIRLVLEHDGAPAGALDLYDYDPFARKAGVGIVLDDQHRGKGWAKEAMIAFEQYVFGTLGLHSLFAMVPGKNEASLALFEGLGYKKIGELDDWVLHNGEYESALLYQKLKV